MPKKPASATPAPRGRPSRKPEIIRATEELLRTRGLAAVTTRAIAEHVGCSEGAIYVHFTGRRELLLAVLESALPEMLGPLDQLEQAVGKGTPQRNLARALDAVYTFQERVFPTLASLFAEPELLNSYRSTFAANRKGPHGSIERIARYIAAEQSLKRIAKAIDPETAATALVSIMFMRCFMSLFMLAPRPTERETRRTIAALIEP
jgi:AcrR family transcriptional regulator